MLFSSVLIKTCACERVNLMPPSYTKRSAQAGVYRCPPRFFAPLHRFQHAGSAGNILCAVKTERARQRTKRWWVRAGITVNTSSSHWRLYSTCVMCTAWQPLRLQSCFKWRGFQVWRFGDERQGCTTLEKNLLIILSDTVMLSVMLEGLTIFTLLLHFHWKT